MPLPGDSLPISESNVSASLKGIEALSELLLELNAIGESDNPLIPSKPIQSDHGKSLTQTTQNGIGKLEPPRVKPEDKRYLEYAHQLAHEQAHQKHSQPSVGQSSDGQPSGGQSSDGQTSSSKDSSIGGANTETDVRSRICQLEEKLNHLEHQVYEPTELINPLIPLMTELLTLQGVGSGKAMLQSLVPIIDEAIIQRFEQDRHKMGLALGQILPEAIAQEIKQSPSAIAKAIAPELAASLQEQIRLDHRSVAETLGPQMGEAIKQQILVERDAMVDALYPVIGNTISKYMGEVVQNINQKIDTIFSFEGFLRKIRARLQGVSEAELILKEAVGCQLQALLLIHKTSGLVIRNVQVAPDFKLEAEMWAGMLTAIRSFVNECVTQSEQVSELHVIAYDDSKIILEVAGYCYIAAVVRGEPTQPFVKKMRQTLSQIILSQGQAIAHYDGEPGNIPQHVDVLLAELAQLDLNKPHPKGMGGLKTLLGISAIALLFILYRSIIASNIETKTAKILDETPELSIYRLDSKVHFGKLTLSGRVPTVSLKDKAHAIVRQAAPNWPLENRVVAVDVPPDPVATAGEIGRLTWLLNQKNGIAITTHHDYGTRVVNITGAISTSSELEQFIEALKKIPGVSTVVSTVQIRPFLNTQFYFESGSSQLQTLDSTAKIIAIRKFLDQNPTLRLKIIGHSDSIGEKTQNKELGLARARTVKEALIAEGVEPARIQTVTMEMVTMKTALPESANQKSLWLSRNVRFEVIIPK